MKKILFFATTLSVLMASFVACGGDSGTSSTGAPAGANDDGSSSSVIPRSSSVIPSEVEGSSSSKAGPNSHQGDESSSSAISSSSSVPSNVGESSSSNPYFCFANCTAECEGTVRQVAGTWDELTCVGGEWLNLDSLNAPSSSSYFDMSEQFNPEYSYGEFTDPRDGQVYKTVTIEIDTVYGEGASVTIFAENLNFGKQIPGGQAQSNSTKYCYDDDPWYCDNGFGGLYTWSTAMNIPNACDSVALGSNERCPAKDILMTDGVAIDYPGPCEEGSRGKTVAGNCQYYIHYQGICPDGWHIWGRAELGRLIQRTHMADEYTFYNYGSKVFGGKNRDGLSLLRAGYWDDSIHKFDRLGSKGATAFWFPAEENDYGIGNVFLVMGKAAYIANHFFSWARFERTMAFSVRCAKYGL